MTDRAQDLEPDRLLEAPHPRDATALIGQDAAEQTFLAAYNRGRLHHGWLLSGPRGVGKATLAWRIARFLLTRSPPGGTLFGDGTTAHSLDTDPQHPINHRISALSEARLSLLRRGIDEKTGRMRQIIPVDDIRRLKESLSLAATEHGYRVVIVDAADDLNINAANALLKLLEEPPLNCILLLVCHAPARLLPTVRSRCRTLRLAPLSAPALKEALRNAGQTDDEDTVALAELADGSAGRALELIARDGCALYAELVELIMQAPQMDRARALAFANRAAGANNSEIYAAIRDLIEIALGRLARSGAGHPPAAEAARGEAALFSRLAGNVQAAQLWAAAQSELGMRMRHGASVNLDPASLILDTLVRVNEIGGRTAQ